MPHGENDASSSCSSLSCEHSVHRRFKACNDDQNIVFSVKRKKMAVIPSIAISSETNVDSFEIDGIIYEQQDTMNGFPRYIETKK